MPYLVEAELLENRALPQNNALLFFHAPQIASESLPGQFVMAAPQSQQVVPSPLLKRALAIYSAGDPSPSSLSLLIKVVGEGTARLAVMNPGEKADLIGPLGNGFDLTAAEGKSNLLIVGGVGIASVYLLASELRRRGEQVTLVYGARTAADLIVLDDFRSLGIEAVLCTNDGSTGFRGYVTEGLEDHLRRSPERGLNFYACGPEPMLKAVATLACRLDVPCQVSVEARMACGFGVCLGCSVQTRDAYRLACCDGPVFQASELVWED
jgi:dihydroorotate dehydrogenase electron transfer subunit